MEKIFPAYIFLMYRLGPKLANTEKMVLYGTLLGGSSLIRPAHGKNCYLSMRDMDYYWLLYKVEELGNFFKIDDCTIKLENKTYRCHSIAYPIFNETYNLFYKDGQKIINPQVLDLLNDTAWMVWFLDAGRKSKRRAYLRTQKFGEAGSYLIRDYFNSLGCMCNVHRHRGFYEIVFTNKGAWEFLATLAHRVPKFLEHRLE